MGDVETADGVSRRLRGAAVLMGLGAGLAAGAVLLGVYGLLRRNLVGTYEVPARGPAVAAVLFLAAAALGLMWLVRRARRGVDVVGSCGWLLTAISLAAAYAVSATPPDLVSSTGSALALLRVSWVVLVAAGVCAVAVAALAPNQGRQAWSWRMASTVALVLGLVLAGGIGGTVWARTRTTVVTAAPIDIPATPTVVGSEVRYALPVQDPGFIVPAGPGFVLLDGKDLVGYSGQTGQQRWRLPFGVMAVGCEPSSVHSTGTATDSVVLAQCLLPAPPASSYSESTRSAVLAGIDAMTGRMLWINTENWRIRSTAVTAADLAPVLRDDEVGALDPRTGKLLWTKHFAPGDCGGHLVGLGNKSSDIVYFPTCTREATLHIAQGRNGAERTLAIEPDKRPRDVSQLDLIASDGSVIVIQISSASHTAPPARVAVDIDTGRSLTLATQYLRSDRRSIETGQYPGAVLQIDRDLDTTSVYLVAEQRLVQTPAPIMVNTLLEGQRWSRVGDQLVTATAATAGWRAQLATVALDGATTLHPSPCGGSDSGGVMPAPGALLVICARTDDTLRGTGYVVMGLR